jgi:hypothetical protein
MSEALSVSLGNSLAVSVVEHVNYDTGVITYAVTGKRLSGSVTLYPHYQDNIEITPSRVVRESGHRPNGGDREDILTINGIQLDCCRVLNLEEEQRRDRDSTLSRRGLFGWENRLPDVTRRYAENVLDALAALWRKRTDIADLMHAAARSNASERLQKEQDTARGLTEQLEIVRAALVASEERAESYRKLQQEQGSIVSSLTEP